MLPQQITIGIIDDQLLFAQGLQELIASIEGVTSVELLPVPSGDSYRIPHKQWDLLFIDINMPYKNGFEISELFKRNSPSQKIALLSVREDRLSMQQAKNLEIEGYIFKSSSKETITEAIHSIIGGQPYFLQKDIDKKKEFHFHDGSNVKLTDRELHFLELLIRELTTKEIADKMDVSIHTVVSYRKKLFSKFNVQNMVGLAKYALEIIN